MKKLTISLIALVFVTLTSATLFAGKQPDISFHPDLYKYSIISGKITEISHFTIDIKGEDRVLCYEDHTKFYRGDNTVAIEKVYGDDALKDCEEITSYQLKPGDHVKCRYTNVGKNTVLLEVVQVVK